MAGDGMHLCDGARVYAAVLERRGGEVGDGGAHAHVILVEDPPTELVDQLDDPNNLTVGCAQRHREDRLCAVSSLQVDLSHENTLGWKVKEGHRCGDVGRCREMWGDVGRWHTSWLNRLSS